MSSPCSSPQPVVSSELAAAPRKLKIAIVCDAVTDFLGGALMSTNRFAERLVQRGHSVVYITGKSPQNQSNGYHGPIEVFRFRSVPAPYYDGRFYLGLPRRREIETILRDRQIDLVHIMLPMPSGLVAMRAAQRLGIPVVNHSHMLPEHLFLNLPAFLPKQWLNRCFFRYAEWYYGQSNAVVFPTRACRQLFSSLVDSDTHVISNGVDTELFRQGSAASFHDKFGIKRNQRTLLFVGRLHPEKNIATVIKAAPRLLRDHPDLHLLIVGDGYLRDDLHRMASELAIAANVTFCGALRGDDLIGAFNAADLFVLPSAAEIEPLVLMEAMACGKPLVVSDGWQGSTSFVEDGNGMVFSVGNHDDLAAKVSALLSDPERLRAMGQRSFERSRQLDIRQSVAALEALYYSLLPAAAS